MDGDRFDSLTRALGSGRSRRSLLRGLGAAALGAAGLARAGRADAANLGNSPCAHFCQTVFPPGPNRGACVSQAAHGTGPCAACGANPGNYCGGACTDTQTDIANCGGCGNACPSDACHSATCVAGVCGLAPANAGAVCADAPDHCTNASTCDAAGNCVAGGPVNCDDQNACTDDSCDPAVGCVNTPITCDDNDACTDDTCDPSSGCVYTETVCPAGDQCNTAFCDSTTGCGLTPLTGQACDSGGGPGSGICESGDCLTNTCTVGSACDTGFSVCNGNENCFCGSTPEGTAACIVINGGVCGDNCGSSAQCVEEHGEGWACVVNTCCGSVCEQLCPAAGASSIRSAAVVASGPQTP
jgi:hypothetical protein